jgi:hypothetical protein
MVYNPETRRWEGNECDLKVFETPNLISSSAATTVGKFFTRPAAPRPSATTTSNTATSGSAVNVTTAASPMAGGMVFDAVLMRWVGNEDEFKDVFDDDCFKDFEDDKDKDNGNIDKDTSSCNTNNKTIKLEDSKEQISMVKDVDAGNIEIFKGDADAPTLLFNHACGTESIVSAWKQAVCIQESEHLLLMGGGSFSSGSSSLAVVSKRLNNTSFCYDLR